MKKVLKIIAGIFAVFFLTVVVILIIDISNDVEYKIVEEDQQGNGLYLRVTTEATSEDDLRTIVEEVKKEKRSTGIDAIWVWIHDPSKKPFGNLLASGRIPYNQRGQIMIGADDSNYLFEMK